MRTQEIKNNEKKQRLWVVFTGQTDLRWVFWLKRGFRHCFVVMHNGSCWVSLDPLASHIEVMVQDIPADFDLPQWLKSQGHEVMEASPARHDRPAPVMPLTCVEFVKRILGVHKRFIFTPWQLYRYLQSGSSMVHQDIHYNKGE